MMHRIERSDIDSDTEKRVLREQIRDLRGQLQVTEGQAKKQIKNMIESRTKRLKEA